VASSENFWALIMDAGTGYCSQVYELSQLFLNKVHYDLFLSLCPSLYLLIPACVCLQEWITEQWEKNYHITAVAGATNGSSLVVMSKGLLIIFSLLNATLIMSTFFCGK